MFKKVVLGMMAAVLAFSPVMSNVVTVKAEEETKKSREDLKIGVSWKTLQEERYATELEEIEKVCEEQGVEMVYQCSENDNQKQVGQIENLISQDVDILIVIAAEKGAVNNVLKEAHDAGIFVCYYEQVMGETYVRRKRLLRSGTGDHKNNRGHGYYRGYRISVRRFRGRYRTYELQGRYAGQHERL